MSEFDRVTGQNWLQGKWLLPALERIGLSVSGPVLDLGAGHSPWRRFFTKAEPFIRMDRYPVDDEVLVIDDIYTLPLAAESMQCVILSQMLGDIPDQPKLWAEVARVLKPGGIAIVYETMSYPQHDLPYDCWRVMPGGLKWAADTAGMTMRELLPCGGYGTQLGMHFNHFIIRDLGGIWPLSFVAKGLIALSNIGCRLLDKLWFRPALASDYFAVIDKPSR
jgi:SAM-dependent methyltransferase